MNKIISIFIFFILLNSCSKNNNLIPNVPVDFRIQASEIGGVGSAIYTETEYGIRGIIIYHYNTNEYIAYERACSFKPSDNCNELSEKEIISAVNWLPVWFWTAATSRPRATSYVS